MLCPIPRLNESVWCRVVSMFSQLYFAQGQTNASLRRIIHKHWMEALYGLYRNQTQTNKIITRSLSVILFFEGAFSKLQIHLPRQWEPECLKGSLAQISASLFPVFGKCIHLQTQSLGYDSYAEGLT